MTAAAAVPAPLADRLVSLDAFRGFAIAAMVLVNNPGDWSHLYAPLAHAPWHGWTFTDWIFPFFLFIVGVAMPISLARRTGAARPRLLLGLWRRAAVIFALGLLLNLIPSFDLGSVRLPGVLQRIALAIVIAAPIVLWTGWRGTLAAIAVLFAAYTLPMQLLPVPGPDGVVAAGVLEPGRDAGAWIDRSLLGGHLWRASKTWDPEGLLSTLPAVATLLFGVLAGRWLARPIDAVEKTVWMLLAGLALVWLGAILDAVLMPINKNLWTPSYAVFTAGWALVVFGAFHWLLDAAPSARLRAGAGRALLPLIIYGMNALAIFVLSGFVARLMAVARVDGPGGGTVSLREAMAAPLRTLPVSAEMASLLWALLFDAAMFAVAWLLWRRRWFIRA